VRGFQTVDLLCERRDLPSALGLRQQDERRPGRDHSREIGHAVAGERVHAHGGDDPARARRCEQPRRQSPRGFLRRWRGEVLQILDQHIGTRLQRLRVRGGVRPGDEQQRPS
jgi:hypothetical protein